MERRWIARPYRYADGVPWNNGRWEIFVFDEKGQPVSVGGAIKLWGGRTIAFICKRSLNRQICTPAAAEQLTGGSYVWANDVSSALKLLKWRFPNPDRLLKEASAREMGAF